MSKNFNEKLVLSFEEFINEAKVVVKRKYTERHPEKSVGKYAPIREKVLSFVKEKGQVTYAELKQYISGVNEESGSTADARWIRRNLACFSVKETKDGSRVYKLSKHGERVHKRILALSEVKDEVQDL